MSKKFSVIVPVYKSRPYLERCIMSLLDQDYRNYEIIVVYDGEKQVLFDIVKKCREKSPKLQWEGEIPILEITIEHGGAPRARNAGAKEATGDYLLFFDADCILVPGALRMYAEAFAEHPDCAFVYGGYRWNDLQGTVYKSNSFDPYLLECNNYISTMNPMKKEIFPGWNESLKSLQDWDLWLRIVKAGNKGYFLNDELIITEESTGVNLSGDSHANWTERTRAVKESSGIPVRDICITTTGALFQSIRRAKILDADFQHPDILMVKENAYKMVYLMGFYTAADTALKCHLAILDRASDKAVKVIQWIGTDVWQMHTQFNWLSLKEIVKVINDRADYQFCNSQGLKRELDEIGINVEVLECPIPCNGYSITPLPKDFTVGFYRSDSNPMHNEDFVKEVARAMPDVKFKFFGGSETYLLQDKVDNVEIIGTVPEPEMPEFISSCSCILRLTVHDGLPASPIEFLMCGRPVIANIKLPFFEYVDVFPSNAGFARDKTAAIAAVRDMQNKLKGKEICEKAQEAHDYWKERLHPAQYRNKIHSLIGDK